MESVKGASEVEAKTEEVKTEETAQEAHQPVIKEITNIGQAIGVLMQGVDVGRQAGVYSWENLETLSKAIAFINTKMAPKDSTPNQDNPA
jgi:hypothetical protein